MNDLSPITVSARLRDDFSSGSKASIFSLCFPYSEYSTCTQNITEIDFLCHHCLEVNPINSNTYVKYTIVYSVYIYLYALYIYICI